MTTTTRRLAEKGQRAARSTTAYQHKTDVKESAYCSGCGVIKHKKRWAMDPEELTRLKSSKAATLLCAACLRIQDKNPAGILVLTGDYLLQHQEEICNLITKCETKSREKNPLGRIMELRQEGDNITISTTEDKLAQKIGRDIYKAHSGSLQYQWSRDQHFVRVSWSR
jgi:NMD protein affecting ribosome stability and mRNA decay